MQEGEKSAKKTLIAPKTLNYNMKPNLEASLGDPSSNLLQEYQLHFTGGFQAYLASTFGASIAIIYACHMVN